jgi:dethiobiotin synthetase
MKGIFITGTDTNIGKTWIGVRLIQELVNQGFDVTPRKPVESGWSSDLKKNDAWKLANAANKTDQLDSICPNRFSHAVSPTRAANIENQQLTIQELAEQCTYPQKNSDFIFIEGAGGFYSPLAQDGYNSDLAQALGLPVLLVAENRLGCINQVLLSTHAIKTASLHTALVVLNNKTAKTKEEALLSQANMEDLSSLLACPVMMLGFNETNQSTITKITELII